MDATIYPADATYFNKCLDALGTVLHFGGHCLGHVQMPVPQSNIKEKTLLKHRRAIEDVLNSKGSEVSHHVSLNFVKPSDSHGNDKRGGLQLVVAAAADYDRLQWSVPTVIGPLTLIKVNEMLGFDEMTGPGPTQRVEQYPVVQNQIFDWLIF